MAIFGSPSKKGGVIEKRGGQSGAAARHNKRGVYDLYRKPLKFLVELKRIELLTS